MQRLIARSVVSLWIMTALLFARAAAADPPRSDDDEAREQATPKDGTPLWVSVDAGLSTSNATSNPTSSAGGGKTGNGASVVFEVGGTLDAISRRTSRPTAAPDAQADSDAPADGASPDGASPDARAPIAQGPFARSLVRAVLRAAKAHEADSRLDDLATRARLSALLPEVRLRVAHTTDEGESLVPTEYDPQRVTASGGTSLWLEGRATFRLDRLVFADDEVQIERLRIERERAVKTLVDEALAELRIWQKAELALHDPTVLDDAALAAEDARLSAEAALDVLSDGWFSAHEEKLPVEPEPVLTRSRQPTPAPIDAPKAPPADPQAAKATARAKQPASDPADRAVATDRGSPPR